YPAVIISFFIRYVERIPIIKDLVKRLQTDLALKLDCEFLVSDNVPSEASYSRFIEVQLPATLLELRQEVPKAPQWGGKKNSDGKNVFWYGYNLSLPKNIA